MTAPDHRPFLLGVCDYPEHVPPEQWRTFPPKMRDLGLSVVRLAEFAWARLEPAREEFDFGWLDDAVDAIHAEGLRLVLGTPTAAPPAWLTREHPDLLLVDHAGRTRKHGSRRHADYSSSIFWQESARITEVLARRYGQHPGVIGWQTDNEHGGHRDTTRSYSPAARGGFQRWLKAKYGTVDALNDAWGAVFWSQTYPDFGDIDLPDAGIELPNPSQVLDFYRYSSDTLVAYDRMQTEILRAHSPGRFVTHNFMALFSDFDHYRASAHLDFVSLDTYPTGSLDVSWLSEHDKLHYARIGHPDLTTLALDLARGLKGGAGFWIMEQQVGQTNWAPSNPLPEPGAVRFWTHVAAAHGATSVVYFRWQAAPMAQEALHSALHLHDGTPDEGYREVARLDLRAFPHADELVRTRVALLHDYESLWAYDAQPHAQDARYWAQLLTFYSALRQLGSDVDVAHPDADLELYDVIVAPAVVLLDHARADHLARLARSGRHLLLGPRTGAYQPSGQVWPGGAPGGLAVTAGVRVTRFDALRPGLHVHVDTPTGRHVARTWAEDVTIMAADTTVLARYHDGPLRGRAAASVRRVGAGSVTYVGAWSDTLVLDLTRGTLERAALPHTLLPHGVRRSRRGDRFDLLHNWSAPADVPTPAGHVNLGRAATHLLRPGGVLPTEV